MAVKRKRASVKKSTGKSTTASAVDAAAEEAGDVHSDDEESDVEQKAGGDDDDDEFFETPDEKRVRLAKDYLRTLDGDAPAKVQEQLTKDVDDVARKTRSQIRDLKLGESRFLKGHKECATCVCMAADENAFFTGGKDCAILRWDVETGTKDVLHAGGRNKFDCGGHFEQVLGLCVVEQRSLLVSCGKDRLVRLWDPKSPPRSNCVAKLHGHNGAISSIVADPDGSQVYTASLDKSIKIWDLAAKRCSDTLLGHVAGVAAMDIYVKGRPVTGSTDKTVRLWKVDKDTHLMFSKHTYSVDAVAALDHDRFVSGSQDGSLCVWSHASKKPLASASIGSKRWVTALGAIRGSDVVLSGSTDGQLRAWRISTADGKPDGKGQTDTKRALAMSEAAPMVQTSGCINAIAVGKRVVVCALGKEHKQGGWFFDKKTKNGVLVTPISYSEATV